MRIELQVVLIVSALWMGCGHAWFWGPAETTTPAPAVDPPEGSGSLTGTEEPQRLTETITGAGAEIVDVANGIPKLVPTWDATTEALRLTTVRPTSLPKEEESHPEREESHPGKEESHPGKEESHPENGESENVTAGMPSDAEKLGNGSSSPEDAIQTPETGHQHSFSSQKPVASPTAVSSQAPLESKKPATETPPPAAVEETQHCLFPEPTLPFCSFEGRKSFAAPNHFNHSSVEEVQALYSQWAWLLQSHCHHSLEWFFCLLLVPVCGPEAQLPCRSWCELLRDSCWTYLDEGRLPVECHTLPDDQGTEPKCLSVSNQKGQKILQDEPSGGVMACLVLAPGPPLSMTLRCND
ncbi:Collagen alpha-1(XVIII) chain [Merluccius polli]|uniref:Collagen alpha-1(XVIII) chain n=1 Tax=Merluccius polli TaxID=89951 RepID=A0AA47NQM2_MERPO|nr:Collagen alpha-1(XVIII) chain [Merluccius polli]